MTTNREFLEALKEEVKKRGTGGYYSARSVQDIDALVSAMELRFPVEPDAAREEREPVRQWQVRSKNWLPSNAKWSTWRDCKSKDGSKPKLICTPETVLEFRFSDDLGVTWKTCQ